MPVKYNNKSIVPAPFVSITKDVQTTDDSRKIGTSYSITLKGVLSAEKGSPTSSGTWAMSDYLPDESFSPDAKMGALLRKQEALSVLFADEGKILEIETPDGSYSRKCNPRFKRIDFPEGGQGSVSWHDKMNYIVSLEADVIYVNSSGYEDWGDPSGYKIQKCSNEWNVEFAEEKLKTYRLTHSVSAVGKRFYISDSGGVLQKPAWENAMDYVLDNIGLGLNTPMMVATGVMNNNLISAFNHVRTQHVGESNGTFQVTETWICFDALSGVPATDDRTFTVRGQDGRTTVSVEGTVQGYEVRDPSTFLVTSSKYTNANNRWTNYVFPNLATDAASIAGVSLYPLAISTSLGVNQLGGAINYHWEYDDRPNPVISGAISESITLNNHNPSDIFASIPVLGRAAGPILQNISTVSARKTQLQIEVVMRAKSQSFTPTQPNTNSVVASFVPAGSVVFLDDDVESWNYSTGRYSRNTSWTWEN